MSIARVPCMGVSLEMFGMRLLSWGEGGDGWEQLITSNRDTDADEEAGAVI